jgi:hypothetical protein
MKPLIRQLLKEVETGRRKEKLAYLLGIGDYLEHPYPDDEGYVEVVQQLVVLLSKENDPEVTRLLVRNIEHAYMYKINLEGISFEPLTSILDGADPFFIRCVLYLLSMTFNRRYIPVVEKYLRHSDETVREEAQYILNSW